MIPPLVIDKLHHDITKCDYMLVQLSIKIKLPMGLSTIIGGAFFCPFLHLDA